MKFPLMIIVIEMPPNEHMIVCNDIIKCVYECTKLSVELLYVMSRAKNELNGALI